jgi:hypothetical protein
MPKLKKKETPGLTPLFLAVAVGAGVLIMLYLIVRG